MNLKPIKRLFLNEPYLSLYPLSGKSEKDQNSLIESFNSCDLSEDAENTETSFWVSTLYGYALAKVETNKLDGESIERNLNFSYKTKRRRKKNKETGEKEIQTETIEKKNNQKIIERFQRMKEKNSEDAEKYMNLVQAFEKSTLTKEDIPLLDELLREHKYKKWMYIVGIVAVICLPIIVFILSKVLQV